MLGLDAWPGFDEDLGNGTTPVPVTMARVT